MPPLAIQQLLSARWTYVLTALLVLVGTACDSETQTAAPGATARTQTVVDRYECNRCHIAEAALEPAPHQTNCAGCHTDILDGYYDWRFWKHPSEQVDRWKSNITHLLDIPTLTAIDRRFERDWLVEYLQSPHDLRPRMGATMPRFAMPEDDAEAIAEYFIGDGHAHPAPDLDGADLEAGRRLMEKEDCGFCHQFGGVEPLEAQARSFEMSSEELQSALKLAPDLRHTRERMSPAALVAWLESPEAIKPDTLMPDFELSPRQRRDVAAYILRAELAAPEEVTVPERLPPLEREVRYAEVEREVFKQVCWHCHSDPAGNNGDGGPGNTGGFGFEGRGLDLGSYAGIQAGRINDAGERESVLEPIEDGTPRLVAHLLARHEEVAGGSVDGVRGMPLGLPPLSMEQIQLVETWIEQGSLRE